MLVNFGYYYLFDSVLALDVQNAVKENIQNMTGVTVARVNVTISGVVFE